MGSIAENLASVQIEIAETARAAGRSPEEITLVAVSKTKPVGDIREAMAAGQVDFGENRPQELRDKSDEIENVQWHMIGRLQRNKVKYVVPVSHLIHSIDSEKLLRAVNKEAGKIDRVVNCLLQVNISDEDQKGGVSFDEAMGMFRLSHEYPFVRITGLMGMAEFTDDETVIRRQFRRLKTYFDKFRESDLPEDVKMDHLSMGMSGDYKIAIEEGATMLRIGSRIFGHR